MYRVTLSLEDACRMESVREHMRETARRSVELNGATITVERGDHTCVTGPDEIVASVLFSAICSLLEEPDTIEDVARAIGRFRREPCRVEQAIELAFRLRTLSNSQRNVVYDELGNTEREGNIAVAELAYFEAWVRQHAWQPDARAKLRSAGF